MTQPTNELLAERIDRLSKDFYSHKKDFKDLEREVDKTGRISADVQLSMNYMKETMGKIEDMMKNFITVQNQQNEKIDTFINSEGRRTSKNNLVSSVIQSVLGFVAALIVFWATGKF